MGIAVKYGARRVRVFGSVARGDADAQGDVDFLVDLEPGRSLLDPGGPRFELEALLGRPVDVVTERGLKPRLRERVLRERVLREAVPMRGTPQNVCAIFLQPMGPRPGTVRLSAVSNAGSLIAPRRNSGLPEEIEHRPVASTNH